jgi:hypothetical protein
MPLRQSVLDVMQVVLKDPMKVQPDGLDLQETGDNIGVFFDKIFPYRDALSVGLPSLDGRISAEMAKSLGEISRRSGYGLEADPAEILDDCRLALHLGTEEDMSPLYGPFDKYGVMITLIASVLVASVYVSHHIATVNNVDSTVVATSVAEAFAAPTHYVITETPGSIITSIITKLPVAIHRTDTAAWS